MSIDWKKLAPHKPIEPGGVEYVLPPDPASERVAQWVLASGGTVLLGGPAGIGKSTELANAVALLQGKRLSILVQLDRIANMQTIQPHHLRFYIAWAICHSLAASYLSEELRKIANLPLNWVRANISPIKQIDSGAILGFDVPFTDLLVAVVAEASRLSTQGRLCLLFDGIEKCPEPIARALFEVFSEIAGSADLVVVVPWYAAFGPGSNQVIASGEKFVAVRPISSGTSFFRDLFNRRLGGPAYALTISLQNIIDEAATMSGGSPRTFLQLIADAATYAQIRSRALPNEEDLSSAFRDQVDSIRRLLLPGDKRVLEEADGTDGTEIELGTRIRLLSHGLLFERDEGNRALLRMPPLVTAIVKDGERV
jgi:hypothetical protein